MAKMHNRFFFLFKNKGSSVEADGGTETDSGQMAVKISQESQASQNTQVR